MNPNTVAQARTARLVREASTPVYSSQTGDVPRWKREQQERAAHALPKHHNGAECEDC